MTKETVLKTQIKRDPVYMYFVGTSEDGFLEIQRALKARRKAN